MRGALLPVIALLLAACGPSGKDIIDQKRGEVEARVKLIEDFAAKVESGQAAQTELKLPEGVKLKFKADGKPGNAMDMHLAQAQGKKPEMEYVHGGVDLELVREHLAGQRLDKGEFVASNVEDFLKPRFVCIVRDASLTLPIAAASGDTFEGGSVEFEVYCYDLQEKKELGFVRGSAKSSDTAMARTKHYENTNEDLKYSLSLNAGVAYGRAMGPFTE